MSKKHVTIPTRITRVGITKPRSPVNETRVIMLYDGGCSLCRREVAHYQRLDKADLVQWVDINADPGILECIGIRYEDAMARLYVLDRAGKVKTGAWAFAEVWDQLPYYRWLSRVLRRLRLLTAIEAVYVRFARWRFRCRGCESDTCRNP